MAARNFVSALGGALQSRIRRGALHFLPAAVVDAVCRAWGCLPVENCARGVRLDCAYAVRLLDVRAGTPMAWSMRRHLCGCLVRCESLLHPYRLLAECVR